MESQEAKDLSNYAAAAIIVRPAGRPTSRLTEGKFQIRPAKSIELGASECPARACVRPRKVTFAGSGDHYSVFLQNWTLPGRRRCCAAELCAFDVAPGSAAAAARRLGAVRTLLAAGNGIVPMPPLP